MDKLSPLQIVEEATIVIVVFSGLDSQSPDHWGSIDNLQWCRERLQERHTKARFVTYTYRNINIQASPISIVDRAARELLSELDGSRVADPSSSYNNLSDIGQLGALDPALPVLFICEGFAGLIVKKALVLARSLRSYSISQRIAGIIFLCTPHNGEIGGSKDRMQMTVGLRHRHNRELGIKQERKDAEDFAQITKDFQQLSSLHMILYFCNDDWQECSGATVLRSDCLWSIKSQDHLRWTTQENHYIIPRSTTAGLSIAYLERAIVGMCEAVSQKSYHRCLESEKDIKALYDAERLTSSCEWFFNLNEYRDWLAAEGPPCLWLCGIAGSGKSTLCSAIIDNLVAGQQRGDVIAYCFLEEGLNRSDCAKHILEVIFRQLQENNAAPDFLFYSLLPQIEKIDSPMSREAFQRLLRTLLSYIGCQNRVLLVLDGLGNYEWIECLVADEVIHINRSRYRSDLVRCLISSRGSCDYGTNRDQSKKVTIDNEMGVQRDVLRFAEYRLANIYRDVGNTNSYLISFAKRICQRGQGLFLWIALVIEGLQWVDSIDEAEREVQSLPPTIDGLYQKILEHIPSQDIEITKKAFAWLIAAKRPLKLTELVEALAIETDPQGAPGILMSARWSWIKSPLIVTTKENIVRFRHPSVRRHLLSTGGVGAWGTSIAEAHTFLARVCLMLSNSGVKVSHSPWRPGGVRCISSVLGYASTYWSFHYGLAEPHSKGLVGVLHHSLTITLTRDCEEILIPESGRMLHIESTILRIAACYGFASLARISLDMGGKQNGLCDSCETPLALAAAGGHSTVVALLIQRGASTAARNCSRGETALQFAAASGSQETTRILLKNGAEANANTGCWRKTPLHAAASSGNLDIIKSLMTFNVNLDAIIPTTGETPLHVAASFGHLQIVKWLVKGLAPSDKEMKSYDSMVQQQYYQNWAENLLTNSICTNRELSDETEAKRSAQESMVELQSLRGRYADINLRTREGRTALHLAAFNGHVTIMRFLLQSGAERDLIDTHQYTALRLAAENGHLSAVELLLTAGADLDSHQLGTTLKSITNNGHDAVANLLAWHFFNLEITGKPCHRSVLALAIKSKRNTVRDAMHKHSNEGHSRTRRLRTRAPSQDRKM